jgi:fluoride exporter
MMTLQELGGVAVGAAFGTLGRYIALETFPVARGTFPTTVLVVNLLASGLLGLFLARLDPRAGTSTAPAWVRAVLVAGLVGAFGTMSLVAVDIALLGTHDHRTAAALYAAATLGGCLLALVGGLRAGRWRMSLRRMPEEHEL